MTCNDALSCMVYQRGQKFVFLLEHKQFKIVLKHEYFVVEHKLDRAQAQTFRARARTRSCPSKHFVLEHKVCAQAQINYARARNSVLEHDFFLLEQKNKPSTPLVHQ